MEFGIPDSFDKKQARIKLINSVQDLFKHEMVTIGNSNALGLTASIGGTYTTPGHGGNVLEHRLYVINRVAAGRAVANLIFSTDLSQPGAWPNTTGWRESNFRLSLEPSEEDLRTLDFMGSHRDAAWGDLMGTLAINSNLTDEASHVARFDFSHCLDQAPEL